MTDWIKNDQKDNVRYGQFYKIVPGNGGNFHVYKDGQRIWVPDHEDWQIHTGYVAPGAISPNITIPAPVAAPAPAPAPSPAPHANANGGVSAPSPSTPTHSPAVAQESWTIHGTAYDAPGAMHIPASSPAPAPAAPATNHTAEVPHASSNGGVSAGAVPVATGGSTQAHSSTPGGATYTVEHGDTLSQIAESHHISLHELEALNPQIKNPDLIHPGEQVNLGGGGGQDSAVAHAASAEFPSSSSYQATTAVSNPEKQPQVHTDGWANGTGEVPPDPAKNAIVASSDNNTDPLKIKDDHSQTA